MNVVDNDVLILTIIITDNLYHALAMLNILNFNVIARVIYWLYRIKRLRIIVFLISNIQKEEY